MDGRYKIVSDGSGIRTRIYDPDGKEMKHVREITWTVSGRNPAVATIVLVDVAVEIEGDWKVARETTTTRELDRSYKPQKVGE
jgi:hypothetical protein